MSELNSALSKAQAEMKNPELDSTNPHFKNRYASLATVRNAVLPVFTKHGLGVVQAPVCTADGAGVRNILTHVGGETMDFGSLILPLSKRDAQGAGSAITYARRYSLQCLAGVVGDEDDDANEATKPQPTTKAAAPKQAADVAGLLKQINTATSIDDLMVVASQLERQDETVKSQLRGPFKEKKMKLEAK